MNDGLVLGQGAIAVALLDALGLPHKGIRGLTIRVHTHEVVLVTVERFVYQSEARNLIEILDRYNLVPEKASEHDATSLGDKAVQKVVAGGA